MQKCEYCNNFHKGNYGSGRFCSPHCARGFATSKNRIEINLKVKEKLSGQSTAYTKTPEAIAKQKRTLQSTLKNKYKNRKIRIKKEEISITKEELEEYRKSHLVCEICGKTETISTCKTKTTPNNLCVDHNHLTHNFRGLLCQNCNSRLGWYENHKNIIDDYLQRGQ